MSKTQEVSTREIKAEEEEFARVAANNFLKEFEGKPIGMVVHSATMATKKALEHYAFALLAAEQNTDPKANVAVSTVDVRIGVFRSIYELLDIANALFLPIEEEKAGLFETLHEHVMPVSQQQREKPN